MTVTQEQAQMLTTLAIACRPHRAPTWDAAGVMAAIGKVRDRSLAEVTLAVIRAASDRECVSPGVIPSAGSHWQEQLKPERWQPTILEPAERCSICSKRRDECESAPKFADQHEFSPDFKPDGLPAEAARLTKEALKAEIRPLGDRPTTTKGVAS